MMCGYEIFEGDLCADCLKSIVFNAGATCPVCGRKTASEEICIECKARLPSYKRGVSPLSYEGGTLALIGAFKNGKPYIAYFLAREMAKKAALLPPADGLVYVPMTRKSLRRRGYNQARLIAREMSRLTGVPVLDGAVRKTGETSVQKQLSRAERENNLKTCFKADRAAVKGKVLLVVDDVCTTGATLNAVTECLKAAGAAAVYCVTAASVPHYKNKNIK